MAQQDKILVKDETLIKQAVEAYPSIYEKVISEWKQPGPDALWLLYSANYLFRVGDIRWAIDPLTLFSRLSNALPLHPQQDFSKLNFLLLTHKHSDHINWSFLKSIDPGTIPWVVPEFLLEECRAQTGIARERMLPAVVGQWIEIEGIRILPLAGSHWEYPSGTHPSAPLVKGLPSVAYLLEFHGKRWYFPGDIRTYDLAKLPNVGKLDGMVAHVWMGRMRNPLSDPPQFEQFCEYYSKFCSDRMILTHLCEVGREMKDIWTLDHAQSIIEEFARRTPDRKVTAHCAGDRINL